MIYLIAQVFISLLLASLIGLFAGWLIWGLVVRRMSSEIASFKDRLRVLVPLPARLVEGEAKHKEALAQIDSLLKQVAALQTFQEKSAQLAQTVAERGSELAKIRGRVMELEPLTAQLRVLEERMQAAVTERDGALADLREQMDRAGDQHRSAAAQQAAGHAAEVAALEMSSATRVREMEARHIETLTQKDEYAAGLSNRIQELAPLRELVTKAGELLQIRDTEASVLQRGFRELEARLNGAETLLRAKGQEADELRSRCEELDAQHRAMAAAHETRTRAIEPLRNALADRDREAARLNEAFATIRTTAAAALSEKDAEVARLMVRIEELVARHQASVAEMESGAAALRSRIQELESASASSAPVKTLAAAAGAGFTTGRFAAFNNGGAVAPSPSRGDSPGENAKIDDDHELNRLRKIADVLTQTPPHGDVVRLAHSYAAARNFQGGSEHDDWIRAENEVRIRLASRLHAEWDEAEALTDFAPPLDH